MASGSKLTCLSATKSWWEKLQVTTDEKRSGRGGKVSTKGEKQKSNGQARQGCFGGYDLAREGVEDLCPENQKGERPRNIEEVCLGPYA